MGLRQRLAIASIGLVLVVAIAFGWLAQRGLARIARERLASELEANGRLAAELLGAAPFAADQRAEVQRRVGVVGRATGMRVTLIEADGTVIADSDLTREQLVDVENHASRPEVQEALAGRTGRMERVSSSLHRPFFYLATPLAGGVLRLAADAAHVQAEVSALTQPLLLAA